MKINIKKSENTDKPLKEDKLDFDQLWKYKRILKEGDENPLIMSRLKEKPFYSKLLKIKKIEEQKPKVLLFTTGLVTMISYAFLRNKPSLILRVLFPISFGCILNSTAYVIHDFLVIYRNQYILKQLTQDKFIIKEIKKNQNMEGLFDRNFKSK